MGKMTTNKEVLAQIRAIMADEGITQADLARNMGVTEGWISVLMNEKRKLNLKSLCKLATKGLKRSVIITIKEANVKVLLVALLLSATPALAGNCHWNSSIHAMYCDDGTTVYQEKRGNDSYFYEKGIGRTWTERSSGSDHRVYENGTATHGEAQAWRSRSSNGNQSARLPKGANKTDAIISDRFDEEAEDDDGDGD